MFSSGPTLAALTALADWMDRELDDELSDRQYMAEQALARIRSLAATVQDCQAAPTPLAPGSAVMCAADDDGWCCNAEAGHKGAHAAYSASDTVPAHTWPREGAPAAVTPAGTVQLSASDVVLVLAALDDALQARFDAVDSYCSDCEGHPAACCPSHLDDIDAIDEYEGLAARLGGDL